MQNYMLIIKGNEPGYVNRPKEEQAIIMRKYGEFVDTLKTEHGFSGGAALNSAGSELTPTQGRVVVDGPFAETKEVVSGYFVYKAESMDAAIKVAKQCPAITEQNLPCQIFELLFQC